jgi:hypothetical protein
MIRRSFIMNDAELNATMCKESDLANAIRPVGKSADVRKTQDLGGRRKQKILDHLAASLGASDTLQACMGAITCDLLEMCQTLKSGLDKEFTRTESPVARARDMSPAMEVYLRVVRQVERLAQLDVRITESRCSRPEGKSN